MIELWAITFALLFVRTTAFFFAVPVFGGRQSPHVIKIGLSFALTMFWLSQLSQPPEAVVDMVLSGSGTLPLLIASVWETLLGVCLGFAFQIILIPAKIAGSYVAQELGLNLAAMTDPTSGSSSDVVANITQGVAVLLFFGMDFHHLMITALNQTVIAAPVAAFWPAQIAQLMGSQLSGTMAGGIQIVSPLVIVLCVVLAGLFVLARAVPTLNLFSFGLALRLIAGLILLLLFLPQIVQNLVRSLEAGRQFIVQCVSALIS